MKSNLCIAAGRAKFRLTTRNQDLLLELASMFQQAEEEDADMLVDLDAPLEFGQPTLSETARADPCAPIHWLMGQSLRQHAGLLWLDASAVLSPSGKKVLFIGASRAGKSTLSLALAGAKRFLIVSEDICFFDNAAAQILALRAPVSIRPGTLDLIEKATGCRLPPPTHGEWCHNREFFTEHDLPLPLDGIVLLERPEAAAGVNCVEIACSAFVRRILPLTNALRLDDGLSRLQTLCGQTRCHALTGGSLEERLEWVVSHFT